MVRLRGTRHDPGTRDYESSTPATSVPRYIPASRRDERPNRTDRRGHHLKFHHRGWNPRAAVWLLLGLALAASPAAAQQTPPPPSDSDETVSKENGEASAIQKREEWFFKPRQAGTKGDMALLRQQAVGFTASRTAALPPRPKGMGIWTSKGPSSSRFGGWAFGKVSGRVPAIAKDWANNVLYVGSASGGVWKSTDDGTSWTPIFDAAGTMTIGAVAIDTLAPTTLWVGTGENTDYWCEDYFGIGLLRSTDQGNTWELRNGTGSNTLENLSEFAGVLVDPRNSNNVVVGGMTKDCVTGVYSQGGIYTSTDAGLNWTKRLPAYVTSVVRSAANADVLWAGVYYGGVYKSTDNGVTWTLQSASSIPTGTNTYGIEVAAAPSDVLTAYALFENNVALSRPELWRTTNGGTSWTRVVTGTNACDGQCSYNKTLKVHPTSTATVYRGTIQLFKSTNSGGTWTNLTGAWGSTQKVHQDTHILLINPSNGNEMYVGSDGGIWKTTNGGTSFTSLNANLNFTQFYGIGIHPTSDDILCGGAQDNSSLARTSDNTWDVQTVTGDGFLCAINPANTSTTYIASYPNAYQDSLPTVYRSTNGILGSFNRITASGAGIAATARIDWVTPYTLVPTNPQTMFLGTYQMYRSTNGGTSWSQVGPADMTLGGSTDDIATVNVSRVNGNYVYAGTTDGLVWRSTDGGTTWTQFSAGLPSRRINDIDMDPTDPSHAFCVVSGFNSAHLYELTAGAWVARGTGLPNVPAMTVLALSSKGIYVGTDVGVFVSSDGGVNFAPFNFGLPAGLVIMDLQYNATTGTMTAGTYGRGAWQYTFCSTLDQCHDAGVYDPGTGLCTNPAKPDGTACDDGSACTSSDACQAGACVGSSPVVCAASDNCHVAGTCNPATGVCSNPAATNGASCNDGNACTQTDSCQSGACVGSSPVVCSAMDQCHRVGTCNAATGVCSNPVAFDGTLCNDNNACTQTDTCQSGACVGSSPVSCTASDQCHVAGTCNPATGTCSNPSAPDGTTCNDGSACTQADWCQSGACVGSSPVTCTAIDRCHVAGTCDPQTGTCSNPSAPDGTTCNDANACTQTDSCQSGVCVGSSPVTCAASDQCHLAGTCDPQTGSCSNPSAPDGSACNDGNACTQSDSCQSGSCVGASPVTCVASDQCHVAGSCDPQNGTCSNPVAPDGSVCDDGDMCTQSDFCQSGTCAGSNPVTCAASDQCHVAGTCDAASGTCSNPAAADGTSCNDGNACTQSDTCQSGACVGASPVTCTATDQCHVAGTCDPASGTCSNPAAPEGLACDDGNACTVSDVCGSGVCAGSTITAPPETTDVAVSADKSTFTWSVAAYATRYDVVRGDTGALPVGSAGSGEICFDDLPTASLSDPGVPVPGSGFWYLARGENACGTGTWGTRSDGSLRVTGTCP